MTRVAGRSMFGAFGRRPSCVQGGCAWVSSKKNPPTPQGHRWTALSWGSGRLWRRTMFVLVAGSLSCLTWDSYRNPRAKCFRMVHAGGRAPFSDARRGFAHGNGACRAQRCPTTGQCTVMRRLTLGSVAVWAAWVDRSVTVTAKLGTTGGCLRSGLPWSIAMGGGVSIQDNAVAASGQRGLTWAAHRRGGRHSVRRKDLDSRGSGAATVVHLPADAPGHPYAADA